MVSIYGDIMKNTNLEDIEKRLEVLIHLEIKRQAESDVHGKNMKFKNQVKILSDAGLQPKEIAKILGKEANNVRVALHELKKRG